MRVIKSATSQKEVGFTANSLNSKYRLIISGTPTFNKLEAFMGLMAFMQNRNLRNEGFLYSLGFKPEEVAHDDDCLWGVLRKFNPYEVPDDHSRACLRCYAQAMQMYIFNPLVVKTFAVQGQRMAQVLKKLMIRRTHSSKLNGRSIASELPSVQRLTFECAFTSKERAHYDAAYADTSSHLFSKNKNKDSVEWNTTTYRKLCLLCSSLGFLYLLTYKATKLAKTRKTMDAHTILMDLRAGQKRKGIADNNQISINKFQNINNDTQLILRYHCTGSPKLRKLLGILAEIVVLGQEKVLVWVNNPAQSEWLQQVSRYKIPLRYLTNPRLQVLRLCGIDALQLRTDLRQKEQDRMIEDFNDKADKVHVLVCSYLVSCAGLNMQKRCRTTIEYEPPPNEATRTHEVGRVKRMGNPS